MDSKIKIWIIEDEALIAQNLQFTLEDLGYEVLGQSYDYESGMEAIENENFDLLLLDINLGGKREENGLAIAKSLREIKELPFIFLTAYNDKDTIMTAAALRPSAYIIKPANAATLFAAVQTAIENHSTKQTAAMPGETSVTPDFFFSKIGTKIHKIYWKDVAKLESTKNYVSIRTFNSTIEYLIRGSLVQVTQNMIPSALQKDFLRVSRAVFLQRSAIKSLGFDSVQSVFGEIESTEETIRELCKIF
jgi:two-component system, LytTR family, response regulator LytT